MVVVPNLLFYIFLFCTVCVGLSLLGDFVISIVKVVQDLREERKKNKPACLVELVNAPMGEGKEMFVFSLDAKEKEMLLDILMFSMNEMMDLNTKDRFQNIYDEEQRKALHENMDFVAVLLKCLHHMKEGEEVLNDEQK